MPEAKYADTGLAPRIIASGHINGLFYFDMEYIRGMSFAKAIENMDFPTISGVMQNILDKFDRVHAQSSQAGQPFRKKILSLKHLSTHSRPAAFSLSYLQKCNLDNLPTASGHGDLTMENIMLDVNNKLYYIDFLDSFFHSPLMDCAKLMQDLNLLWSWRHSSISFSLIINLNYAKKILLNYIRSLSASEQTAVTQLELLNVLRIIPYSRDEATLQWCDKSLLILLSDLGIEMDN